MTSAPNSSVFICHASEDKETFVRPLASALRARGANVWYDEFAIEWGDSLRKKIDQGIHAAAFGIVVLSKAFFSKPWPAYELDGLLQREMAGAQATILPIWHNVTRDDVLRFSASLAGRLALSSSEGPVSLADKIWRRTAEVNPDVIVDQVIHDGSLDNWMLFTGPETLRAFLHATLERFQDQNAPNAACHFFCQLFPGNSTVVNIETGVRGDQDVLFVEVTGERPEAGWQPFSEIQKSSFGGSSVNENGVPVQTWWTELLQSELGIGVLHSMAGIFLDVLSRNQRFPIEVFAGLMPLRG